MNLLTPAHRDLANWLLAQEVHDPAEPKALQDAAERACQKLSERLTRLVTLAGYQALVARAVHLARGEYPFLEGVRPGSTSDVCLDGLQIQIETVDTATLHDGLTEVLAGVIGLLVTFIGEDLALRLVRDVWPDAPFGGSSPQQQEVTRP